MRLHEIETKKPDIDAIIDQFSKSFDSPAGLYLWMQVQRKHADSTNNPEYKDTTLIFPNGDKVIVVRHFENDYSITFKPHDGPWKREYDPSAEYLQTLAEKIIQRNQ